MPHERGLTRVTLVENHVLFAEALDIALTLEGYAVSRVTIDAQALRTDPLVRTIVDTRPNVVLLDLNLGPSTNGVSVIRPLTQIGIPAVVITSSQDPARWGECLDNGASTVICKSKPLSAILSVITLINEEHWHLPDEERERLIAVFHEDKGQVQDCRARLATLTPREREILDELLRGRQVRQIAQDFVVSEATVRAQVKSILAKMSVSSQLAAVGLALRGHWPQPARREPDSLSLL
ncbi:MAG: response regulator transcription factor [Nocardioides sp.]